MHTIYSLTYNNMTYVGQTNNVYKRMSVHKTRSKTHTNRLYTAMRQHGFDKFKFHVLAMCESKHDANMIEKTFIHKLGTLNMQHRPNGYAY